MSTPRRSIIASTVVALVSLFACAAPPDPKPESEQSISGDALFVDASEDTKRELGVSRWRIETHTDKARTVVVTGLDDRDAERAQLWIERTSRGEGRTAIEVGASASSEPILRFVMEPDGDVTDVVSGVTDRPALRRFAELVAADVEAGESAMGRSEASLIQRSLFPRAKISTSRRRAACAPRAVSRATCWSLARWRPASWERSCARAPRASPAPAAPSRVRRGSAPSSSRGATSTTASSHSHRVRRSAGPKARVGASRLEQ